jgi:hypothetical protein
MITHARLSGESTEQDVVEGDEEARRGDHEQVRDDKDAERVLYSKAQNKQRQRRATSSRVRPHAYHSPGPSGWGSDTRFRPRRRSSPRARTRWGSICTLSTSRARRGRGARRRWRRRWQGRRRGCSRGLNDAGMRGTESQLALMRVRREILPPSWLGGRTGVCVLTVELLSFDGGERGRDTREGGEKGERES